MYILNGPFEKFLCLRPGVVVSNIKSSRTYLGLLKYRLLDIPLRLRRVGTWCIILTELDVIYVFLKRILSCGKEKMGTIFYYTSVMCCIGSFRYWTLRGKINEILHRIYQ